MVLLLGICFLILFWLFSNVFNKNFSSVTSVQEVMKYVGYGMRERHEDATKVHAHSSRSHLIVQLTLYTSSNQISPPAKGRSVAPSPPVTPRGLKRGGSYDKDPRSRSRYVQEDD